MNRSIIFGTLLTFILLYSCASRHKVTYDIPANFPQERRDALIDAFKKGEALYKIHCSDCHGIFTEGKDKIPNFTNVQLDNYSSRFMRRDPRNHAVAQQMSPDQLNQTLTFLRYLKRDHIDSAAILTRRRYGR
jgi:mono/diheme cytochrome c family protein